MATMEVFRGKVVVQCPVKARLKHVVVLQNNPRTQVKYLESAVLY